jgi:hypothetical protein
MEDSDESGPTHHFTFNTDLEDPVFDIVETIGQLEGKRVEELPSFHEQVDGIVDRIFSTPPTPEAQVEVAFTYAGYRIKLHQDGTATFLKIA